MVREKTATEYICNVCAVSTSLPNAFSSFSYKKNFKTHIKRYHIMKFGKKFMFVNVIMDEIDVLFDTKKDAVERFINKYTTEVYRE